MTSGQIVFLTRFHYKPCGGALSAPPPPGRVILRPSPDSVFVGGMALNIPTFLAAVFLKKEKKSSQARLAFSTYRNLTEVNADKVLKILPNLIF